MNFEQRKDIISSLVTLTASELDAAEIYIKRIIDTRENFCA